MIHLDTWRTGGLRGTGRRRHENGQSADPRRAQYFLTDDEARIKSPLYAFPAFGMLALGVAAVASGSAQGALADLRDHGRKVHAQRPHPGRARNHAGPFRPGARQYSAARAFLYQEIDAAWGEAQAGVGLGAPRRAELRLAATHMARTAADIVRRLQDFAGGASVFLSDPLQRRLGDAQTATAHIMIAPMTYEMIGRVLLSGEAHIAEL